MIQDNLKYKIIEDNIRNRPFPAFFTVFSDKNYSVCYFQ